MKILFLCKRRPQGRDLFDQPYGRFYYLPRILAEYGHEGYILLLSYKDDPEACRQEGNLHWHTVSARHWGPEEYIIKANRLAKRMRPDWIIGFSDIWYGILAERIAKMHGVNSLIDAYDNYESYIPWAKPLHWVWRSSLQRATALTAAGPQLAALMCQDREGDSATVLPMAADPIFQPIDDDSLRGRFDLPEGVPLVGYCGALYRNRGVEVLFQAMECLLAWVPDAKLVISGRKERGVEIPKSIDHAVIQLGYLPDDQMPLLLNALDVLLVVNRHSAFGNYSYPVKLYEAMQCRKPVIATDAAGTSWVLRDHPECLADGGNPEDIARRLRNALSWKTKEYISNCDWVYSASILRDLLAPSSII